MGTGALLDDRPQELKEKDYQFSEIVSTANPVTWVEKPRASWRNFPIFNQDGSGSCVAQTIAKLLGVLYWLKNNVYVHFSATHVYQRRANKPSAGMTGVNALDIAREGVTLEALVPSQDMNDAQMDGAVIEKYKEDVGKIFKIGNYVILPIADIETVASVIQTTKKAVMVWFYFQYDEWTEVPVVKNASLNIVGQGTVRHSVTAVDFTLYQGKKALIIEDSWGTSYGLAGQRVITEDFYKARNFFAAYPIDFKFAEQTDELVKPIFTFSRDLVLNETSNDVKALQDILKFEGLFPNNVESTGFYGSITAKAIYQFQVKHQVASQSELDSLQGKRVGEKTRQKLNQLYGSS